MVLKELAHDCSSHAPVQGDQAGAVAMACCWCGGGTGKGEKEGPQPAAGVVEALTRARRRGHREPHSTSVQKGGSVVVDALAAAVVDASLATSRWCRSRDCRRRATAGHPCCCCHCCCRSHWSLCSCLSPFPCPYPCLCHCCWGWGRRGRGLLRTRWFLLRWARRQLLLWRVSSS
jgi:hypothetical protein